jgi:CHAD domain-containing protein
MRVEDRVMELSAEEGARRIALGLLADAVKAADALASGAGAEPLHDFRIALRRLRSALRTYRPWLGDGLRRKDERRLRKLARSTSPARDAEVQLAWLSGKRDAFASERRRPGFELVVARYEARAHGGPDAAGIAARFRRAAGKLRRRLRRRAPRVDDGAPGAAFAAVLASLVAQQADALVDGVRAIAGAADEAGVHRARIEGKRLRYLVEPLRGYARADASAPVARLKRLQDLLGDLHDAHVLDADLGEALVEAAAERARRVHAAAYAQGTGPASIRGPLRRSPRPGLLALVGLVRERRDARFAELERESRAGGMGALAREVEGLAEALRARPAGATSSRTRTRPRRPASRVLASPRKTTAR